MILRAHSWSYKMLLFVARRLSSRIIIEACRVGNDCSTFVKVTWR